MGGRRKRLTEEASVPNVISRNPAPRAKFFKKSQKSARALPFGEDQKSPASQNCFQRSAVTAQ